MKSVEHFGPSSYVIQAFMKTFCESLTGGDAQSNLGISAFVKTFLDNLSASSFLTTLGFSAFIKTLIGDADAGTARTTMDAAKIKTREQHGYRLARDYDIWVNDELAYEKEKLQPIGDFWESLYPPNKWGGNFKKFVDTPHFERVKA